MGVIFSSGGSIRFRSARLQMARVPEVSVRLHELHEALGIERNSQGLFEWFVSTSTAHFLPYSPLSQSVGVVLQVALWEQYRRLSGQTPRHWVAEGLGLWALQIVQKEKNLDDLAQALRQANTQGTGLLSIGGDRGRDSGGSMIQFGGESACGVDSNLASAIEQLPSQRWVYLGVEDLHFQRLRSQLPHSIDMVDILQTNHQLRSCFHLHQLLPHSIH